MLERLKPQPQRLMQRLGRSGRAFDAPAPRHPHLIRAVGQRAQPRQVADDDGRAFLGLGRPGAASAGDHVAGRHDGDAQLVGVLVHLEQPEAAKSRNASAGPYGPSCRDLPSSPPSHPDAARSHALVDPRLPQAPPSEIKGQIPESSDCWSSITRQPRRPGCGGENALC